MDKTTDTDTDFSNSKITTPYAMFEATARYDSNKIEIERLQDENQEINENIRNYRLKICDYLKRALEIAFKRHNCSPRMLNSLAQYDDKGIFLYFKHLNQVFLSSYPFKNFTTNKSKDECYFEYGDDASEFIFLPVKIFMDMGDDVECLADRITDHCNKTIDKMKKELSETGFLVAV